LARLSRHRPLRRLSLGPGDTAGADLHVLDPGPCDRHPAAGSADAALPRRALPRLSVAYEPVFPVTATSMIPKSGGAPPAHGPRLAGQFGRASRGDRARPA